VVTGETAAGERDARIEAFQRGELRALVNVNVLSEGFDATHVDAVIMMRPTKSAALYYQQAGRGMRLHPGKPDCLVLDFAGNIVEHGPVDAIRPPRAPGKKAESAAPVRECPACHAIAPVQVRQCPDCGHPFPVQEHARHDATASNAAILSDEVTPPEVWPVTGVSYRRHDGKRGIPTLQVTYLCGLRHVREWVCLEHSGFARSRAVRWWLDRSPQAAVPHSVDDALEHTAQLIKPTRIRVQQRGKYHEIIGHEFDTPDARAA
jgi:DNA repair protein RadD